MIYAVIDTNVLVSAFITKDHGVGSTDHFLKFLYYTSFLTPHSICIFYVRDSLNSIKTNTIFVFSL